MLSSFFVIYICVLIHATILGSSSNRKKKNNGDMKIVYWNYNDNTIFHFFKIEIILRKELVTLVSPWFSTIELLNVKYNKRKVNKQITNSWMWVG